MRIDSQGYTVDTLDDILSSFETYLRGKYGDDFYIKAESVISNIFTSTAFQELDLQEQIAYLIKQFDPQTAEGEFLDALCERLLVYRIKGQATIVERTIVGVAGLNVQAGAITIRNKATLEEFVNKEVTIGENGQAVTDFECVLTGAIELPDNAEIEIVSMPLGVNNVILGENPKIDLGRDREKDEELRTRYKNEKSKNAKASRNANFANLSKFVDDENYLTILDKKTDREMEAGTIKIIANHNTTDNQFANAIFETIADGIDTLGTTTVTVKDSVGQDVVINWINSDFTEIAIRYNLKAKEGYFYTTVANKTKENIIDYINNRIYGLGQTVYSNEFTIPIYRTEGVENVTDIEISVNGSEDWKKEISINGTSLAMFSTDWMIANEV